MYIYIYVFFSLAGKLHIKQNYGSASSFDVQPAKTCASLQAFASPPRFFTLTVVAPDPLTL